MVDYRIYADGELIYSSLNPEFGAVLSPQLKLEVNKSGSLSFTMLPNHPSYDNINVMKTLILVYQDEDILFRGRVIEATPDFYKQKSITCEGDLSFLLDSAASPFKYSGSEKKTIRQIFEKIITDHNEQMRGNSAWKRFIVGEVSVTGANTQDEWENTSYSDSSSVMNSQLVDVYGGILKTRTVLEGSNLRTYIDYVNDPTQMEYPLNNQTIEFGVNLLEFDASYPVSDIFTVLLPIGKDKTTIASVNGGSRYLENSDAIAKFGRIVKAKAWSDISKPTTLKTKAQEYLNEHSKLFSDDLTIKAIDLHYLNPDNQRIQLCDRVKVYSEPHGIGTESDMILFCLEIEYDLQNPENNSYKLGTFIPSDKDKSKIKNRGSRGSSRGGRKASSTNLTDLQASSEETLNDTVDGLVEESNEEKKGFLATIGDKALDALGVDLPSGATVQEKVHEGLGLMGLGNNTAGEEGTSATTETDLWEGLKFWETKDEKGKTTDSGGVKTLSEATDDIMLTGRNIALIAGENVSFDAGGNIILTSAGNLSLHTADIADINARKIKIEAAEISIDSDVINITGAIKSLVVDYLSAGVIQTINLGADGGVEAGVGTFGILRARTSAGLYNASTGLYDSFVTTPTLGREISDVRSYVQNNYTALYNHRTHNLIQALDVETAIINGYTVLVVSGS